MTFTLKKKYKHVHGHIEKYINFHDYLSDKKYSNIQIIDKDNAIF